MREIKVNCCIISFFLLSRVTFCWLIRFYVDKLPTNVKSFFQYIPPSLCAFINMGKMINSAKYWSTSVNGLTFIGAGHFCTIIPINYFEGNKNTNRINLHSNRKINILTSNNIGAVSCATFLYLQPLLLQHHHIFTRHNTWVHLDNFHLISLRN